MHTRQAQLRPALARTHPQQVQDPWAVAPGIEDEALGVQPITPRPARLLQASMIEHGCPAAVSGLACAWAPNTYLEVALQAFAQREVHHEPHVGLVNALCAKREEAGPWQLLVAGRCVWREPVLAGRARGCNGADQAPWATIWQPCPAHHAKGNRGHNDLDDAGLPVLLHPVALRGCHACVVVARLDVSQLRQPTARDSSAHVAHVSGAHAGHAMQRMIRCVSRANQSLLQRAPPPTC